MGANPKDDVGLVEFKFYLRLRGIIERLWKMTLGIYFRKIT